MKNYFRLSRFILFAELALIVTPGSSQNFCDAIKKIQEEAKDDFKNIRTSVRKTIYNDYQLATGSGYETTITIPASVSCMIGKDDDGTAIYWTEISKHSSQADGEKKFMEIRKQLETCLKLYYTRNPPEEEWKKNTLMQNEFGPYEVNKKTMPYIFLQLEKKSNEYVLNMRLVSPNEGPGVACRQLKEIMKYAYTNFEEINLNEEQAPEEISADGFEDINFDHSRASLRFPGAKLSSIEELTDFSAYFGIYKTTADAIKKTDSLKIKLSGCLPGYKLSKPQAAKEDPDYIILYKFNEIRTDKKAGQEIKIFAEKNYQGLYKVRVEIKGLKNE